MAAVIKLACDQCEYTEDLETKSRQYEIDEDDWLPLEPALGWCFECGGVREVELLPKLDDTLAHVEKLRAADPTVVAALEEQGRFAEDEIEFHQVIVDWLQSRESPPRCLECGETKFELVFEPDEMTGQMKREGKTPHPTCGGMLLIAGVAAKQSRPDPSLYSLEGELLED